VLVIDINNISREIQWPTPIVNNYDVEIVDAITMHAPISMQTYCRLLATYSSVKGTDNHRTERMSIQFVSTNGTGGFRVFADQHIAYPDHLAILIWGY